MQANVRLTQRWHAKQASVSSHLQEMHARWRSPELERHDKIARHRVISLEEATVSKAPCEAMLTLLTFTVTAAAATLGGAALADGAAGAALPDALCVAERAARNLFKPHLVTRLTCAHTKARQFIHHRVWPQVLTFCAA